MTGQTSEAPNQLRSQFGKNVKALRELRGVSQEELGFLTSLHRTEIGQLERGTRLPRLDTILKLTAGLEVTLDEMLAGMAWSAGRFESGSFVVGDVSDLDRGPTAAKTLSRPGSAEP